MSGLHEASDTDMRKLDKVNNITTELTQMYAPRGDKTKEKVLKEICDVTMMEKCVT